MKWLARTDVKITDFLPSSLQFLSASTGAVYDAVTHTITWSNMTIQTDWSGVLFVSARVNSWFIGYDIYNTGSIISCSWGICDLNPEYNTGNNTWFAHNEIYDLYISKAVDRYYTYNGDTLTYTIKYQLSGNARNDIMVNDMLPVNVTYISWSITADWVSAVYNSSTHTVTYSGLSLAKDGFGYIYITVKTNTNPTYIFINNTNICNNTGSNNACLCTNENNCTNNTWAATNEVYDLSIIKTNDKYYTKSWDILNYTLQYSLSGNARNDIKLLDTLPTNVSFVSGDNGAYYNSATHQIVRTWLSASTDGIWYVHISVKVLSNNIYTFTNTWNVCTYTWVNTSIGACNPLNEYNTGNNQDKVNNEIYDLVLTETNNKYYTYSWDTIIYTINYWLSGNARPDVKVLDILSSNVSFISASNWGTYDPTTHQVIWNNLSLATDASWILTITAKVLTNDVYTFRNTWFVCTYTGANTTLSTCTPIYEYNQSNNTDSVENAVYNLSVVKTADKYYTKSWDVITYNLRYSLSGDARSDIKLVDILPNNLTYISNDHSGIYDSITHTITRSDLSLWKDSYDNITVKAKVDNNTTYNFTNTWVLCTNTGVNIVWQICTPIFEYNTWDNVSRVDSEIYDLTVKKSVDITWWAFFEEQLVYTLVYQLSGNARNDISIVDKLPDEVEFVSADKSGYSHDIYNTWANAGDYISWTGIFLPKDWTATIKITTNIRPFSRFASIRNQILEQATKTAIVNNVKIWTYNTKNYSQNTLFTYEPEFDKTNNLSQAATYMRCRKDWWSCVWASSPIAPTTKTVCRNNQTIEIYDFQSQSSDIVWACMPDIYVCRDDKVVIIKQSDLKSTDIQWNSCPKIMICRDNNMIAITKPERLQSDTITCAYPLSKNEETINPFGLPRTGIDIYNCNIIEAKR